MDFSTLTTIGSGQIDGLGDSDLFRLALSSGKQYQVTVRGEVDFDVLTQTEASAANTAVEQVFLTTQPTVISDGTGFTSTFYVEPDQDYFANVSTRFNSFFEPIPYEIDVIEVTDDVIPSPSTAATVAIGAPYSGTFEFAGDQDWIKLDVAAGQNYSLNSDMSFFLLSLDPNTGEQVTPPLAGALLTGFGTASQAGFFAEDGVDYVAVLTGGTAFGEVPYSLTLGTLLSDVANSASTTVSVAADASVQGQVNGVGDYDWIGLETAEGQSYAVTVSFPNGIFGQVGYNLIETDAATGDIVEIYEGLTTRLPFSARPDAAYFVEVIPSVNANSNGLYEVALETYEDDAVDNISTATILGLDGPTTIQGETSNDTDYIRLDVQAGQSYLIRSDVLDFEVIREDQTAVLSKNGALGTDFEDPRVDAGGIDLANNSFVAKLDVEDGYDYFVAAEFGALFAVQDVSFTLEETEAEFTDNANTTARVGVNETLSGVLEIASDQDWILLDLDAGQSAAVSISGLLQQDSYRMFAVNADQSVEYLDNQEFFPAFGVGTQTIATGRQDASLYLQVGAVEGLVPGGLANSSYSVALSPVSDAETDDPMNAIVLGSTPSDIRAGTDGNDVLSGDTTDDTFFGDAGDDVLNGGAGIDTARYSGSQTDFTLLLESGQTRIEDRLASRSGTDTLTDIEVLDFDTDVFDGPFDLSLFGGAASLSADDFESFIELYIAYFNRAPDAIGLNFWGTAFANGTSLSEMATLFIEQVETRATYPEGQSNTDFATAVYDNVLGRTPDQLGFDFWVNALDSGNVSSDQFILAVLDGAKAEAPADAPQEFIDQVLADRTFLSNKTDLGSYFAVHKGMSDVENASSAMALFDGSDASLAQAVTAIDGFFADAVETGSGEFLIQVVGVLTDPFS